MYLELTATPGLRHVDRKILGTMSSSMNTKGRPDRSRRAWFRNAPAVGRLVDAPVKANSIMAFSIPEKLDN
jgi:hypothetical protein